MSSFQRKLREQQKKSASQTPAMSVQQIGEGGQAYANATAQQQDYYHQMQNNSVINPNQDSVKRAMTQPVKNAPTQINNTVGVDVMLSSQGPKFGQSSKTVENKFGGKRNVQTSPVYGNPGSGTQSTSKTITQNGSSTQRVASATTIHATQGGPVAVESPSNHLVAPRNQVASTTPVNQGASSAARTIFGEAPANPMTPLGAQQGVAGGAIQWNRMARTDLNFGVVLNVFNRKPLFADQLRQIAQGTVRPKFLMVNAYGQSLEELGQLESFDVRVSVAQSSDNLGAWLRFHQAYEMMHDVDFVLVLDDDAFPGISWVENAIEFARNQDFPVIVATSGRVFDVDGDGVVTGRAPSTQVAERVTFGTGGWLIPSSVLETFVGAIGRFPGPWGWQIHLDFAAQAAGGGTFVLNMPGNQNSWGSVRDPMYDGSNISVIFGDGFSEIQDEAIAFYEALGWKAARVPEDVTETPTTPEEPPVVEPEVVEE